MMPLWKLLTDFFQSVKGSCLSFDFYRRIACQPVSSAFLYLLYLSLLISLVATGLVFVYLQQEGKPFLARLSDDFPECVIRDGKMSCDTDETLIIESFLLTLGVYPGEDPKKAEALLRKMKGQWAVLLTEDQVFFRDSNNRDFIHAWSDLSVRTGFQKITGNDFRILRNMSELFLIPFFFFFVVSFFLSNLFQTLYFTAFGFLFSRMSEMGFAPDEQTSFRVIFQIAVYASTPAALLLIAILGGMMLFHLQLISRYFQIVYMLMFAAFFIGGYHAVRREVGKSRIENRK